MSFYKAFGILSTTLLAGSIAYSVATGHGLHVRTALAGPQPNMEDAARRLRAAKAYLERAEHNKGGHRVRAIEIVDQAIVEVDKGMAAAD